MKKCMVGLVILMLLMMATPAMAGISVTTSGENRTVTLTYTSTAAKINATLEAAAKYLYLQGIGLVYNAGNLVPFNSLTNAQKLKVIDTAVKEFLRGAARTQINKEAEQAANSAGSVIEE